MPHKRFSDEETDPKNKALIERKRKRKAEKVRERNTDEIGAIAEQCKTFDPKSASHANTFDAFPLSSKTLRGLRDEKFTQPTDIQRQSLGHSLTGKDVVGAAKTGSGKTLALLIPMLECLWRARWTKFDGLGALVLTPTRELAFQIFQVLNTVGRHHDFSVALLIGGTDVEYEKSRVGAMNIIICTPGRLLQHMDENEHFQCAQLQMLVIDEADRILDMGFRRQVDAIVENLPHQRQTLLFSATQTKRVEDLVRVSLKEPVFVSAHEHASHATPDQLQQSYFVCEEEDKLNMLWSFLKAHKYKKTLIFVTCCKQARFYTEAIAHLRPGLYFTGLWGDLKQTKRMERFQRFDQNTRGAAMICTDLASRGLDFNNLDWVLQMDCPASVEDYIHRVGRTARMDNKGEAMLMLSASQEPFVDALRARNVPIDRVGVNTQKVRNIHGKLANLMVPFPQLKQFAQKSFVAYARAIYFMKMKNVFDVQTINFDALAKSYGLPLTPRIRFLKRQGIQVGASGTSASTSSSVEKVELGGNAVEGREFLESESDEEKEANKGDAAGEGFLKVKRRDVFADLPEMDSREEVLARMSTKKHISRVHVAKKMVRRIGVVGKRKRFDEEEEDDDDEREEEAKMEVKEGQ